MRYTYYALDFEIRVERSINWETYKEVLTRRDVAKFIKDYRANGEKWRVLKPGFHMVNWPGVRTDCWYFRIEEDQ